MPNYVVLRLVPPSAIDTATFETYNDPLTINVWDISYASTTNLPPARKEETV
jgi:hypothetical protein